MSSRDSSKDVLINCPFDDAYKPVFDAIVFSVYELGFGARCALEIDDASEVRLEKIKRIIAQCPYGIHDISSVGLGLKMGLPRFNMPLELGLFLGSIFYGPRKDRNKACLILDSDPYRYRASISDISGQDIHAHGGDVNRVIVEVRNWLVAASKTKSLPGGAEVSSRYSKFKKELPEICKRLKRKLKDLTFLDFTETVEIWLKAGR